MSEDSDSGKSKRRRRGRRRRGGKSSASASPGPEIRNDERQATPRRSGGRRQMVEFDGAPVAVPASGRNPQPKRSSRSRRSSPGSVAGRRRKLSKVQLESLTDWMEDLPEVLLSNLYKGLGGQPKRVGGKQRMIQLAVRAILQGNRLHAMVKNLHDRDRAALGVLLQCGGVAHAQELQRELHLTLGGHEREWRRSLQALAERGVVVGAGVQGDDFYYVVPEPLIDALLEVMDEELKLSSFDHPDVRVIEATAFAPPLDFSITSLATYISQRPVRLTQRHDVHKHDKEAMDEFFGQLWKPDSELFQFHLNFLMMHSIVALRGDHLHLDRGAMEEWLQLEPEDQRDLIFRALERHFELGEWVLWALHGTEGWVAERPLMALYRHWKRGRDWRERLKSGTLGATRANERDSFTFYPLVQCGLLELGQWGQEKFYRLTERARILLDPPEDDGFSQFYLTPDYKVMAPAGLAPVLVFRIGELADFVGCDRANSYSITETSIERAIAAGWRRDDVLQFLRDNSAIGLPDNVESTLKGWIGHRGDVEFHDLMLLTVHRSQIRRLESSRRVKPYILHRFAPGMYAVDRRRHQEIYRLLDEAGFSPSKDVRGYPGDAEAQEARASLTKLVAEAREAAVDPTARDANPIDASSLTAVPGTRASQAPNRGGNELPPEVDPASARKLLEAVMASEGVVEMVYRAKSGQRLACEVQPQRLAFKDADPVLVGLDINENERRTFVLDRIERLRQKEA